MYESEVSIDGSIGITVQTPSNSEAQIKSTAATQARHQGYDHITEDHIEIVEGPKRA